MIHLVIMLLLFASLVVLYLRVGADTRRPSLAEAVCLRAPFSVYLGWISVATIANTAAVLTAAGWNGFGIPAAVWTVIVLAAAAGVALAGLFLRKDFMFGLVFVWAFLGIWLKRSAPYRAFVPEVAYTALVVLVLTAVGVVIAVVRTVLDNRSRG